MGKRKTDLGREAWLTVRKDTDFRKLRRKEREREGRREEVD